MTVYSILDLWPIDPLIILILSWYVSSLYSTYWLNGFYPTHSSIPAISLQSVLVVEETGVSWENHRAWAGNWQTLSCMCLTKRGTDSQHTGYRLQWLTGKQSTLTILAEEAHVVTLKLNIYFRFYLIATVTLIFDLLTLNQLCPSLLYLYPPPTVSLSFTYWPFNRVLPGGSFSIPIFQIHKFDFRGNSSYYPETTFLFPFWADMTLTSSLQRKKQSFY